MLFGFIAQHQNATFLLNFRTDTNKEQINYERNYLMKRIRRLIFPVILLLAALALLWYYWVRPSGSLGAAWNTFLNPPALSATALTASGTVEMTEINVAPEAAGKILAVNVKEGDTVQVGQVLAQLDDTLLKHQRAIAAS